MDDQVLDLALMTNYSQSTFMLLARCQYLHRFNIVWVGHPTTGYLTVVAKKSRRVSTFYTTLTS